MQDDDDGFDKAFDGFGEEPKPPETPASSDTTPPETPPADPAPAPAVVPDESGENKPGETPPAPTEEPKKDEPKKPEEVTPPTSPEKKPEEKAEPPKDPAAPTEPETPKPAETPEEAKPLTKEDVTSIFQNVRAEERASAKELDTTTQEVLDSYYPDGLSNTLIDKNTGKELKTPQDVVEVTNGEMSTEEAQQWLLNEQFKLDQKVSKIKEDARQVAETTINFKRDGITAVRKYEPLFKAYPALQEKVFKKLMKQVKVDNEKGVVLSAPDVLEHYDDYLEPYQLAFEHSQGKSATNPTAPADPQNPPPAQPGAEDRMDVDGDGGASAVDDPNDFAQQVTKELAKEI